jgi:hypothetical protein
MTRIAAPQMNVLLSFGVSLFLSVFGSTSVTAQEVKPPPSVNNTAPASDPDSDYLQAQSKERLGESYGTAAPQAAPRLPKPAGGAAVPIPPSTSPPSPLRTTPQVGIRTTDPKIDVGSDAPRTCGEIRDREIALAMGCIAEPQNDAKGTTVNNMGTNPTAQVTAGCSVAHLNYERVKVPLSIRSPQLGPPSDAEKETFQATEGTYLGAPNPAPVVAPNCPPQPQNPEAGFQGAPGLPSSCQGQAGVLPGRVCADRPRPATNAAAPRLPISPRSPRLGPPSDGEQRTYPATEGAFGGGTFAPPQGR